MDSIQYLDVAAPFPLESGAVLPGLRIAYQTWGSLAPDGANVVWVCHALTANSDATDWWAGLIGPNSVINTRRFFVVCMNILGSCYGTSGPESINPQTGAVWGHTFPEITIRDMVQAHILLRKHLGIRQIAFLLGGSLGGQQALEWLITEPGLIRSAALIATNACHSPWGIAFNATQRMAIETDPTWVSSTKEAGKQGLATARAIAILSYRGYKIYHQTQADAQVHHAPYKAETYQRYQGEKLMRRFSARSYWHLTLAMDSHHVGRGRGAIPFVLGNIRAKVLVIGISNDILFPNSEQRFLASCIPNASYAEITSEFGHDGFLVETGKLSEVLTAHFSTLQSQHLPQHG